MAPASVAWLRTRLSAPSKFGIQCLPAMSERVTTRNARGARARVVAKASSAETNCETPLFVAATKATQAPAYPGSQGSTTSLKRCRCLLIAVIPVKCNATPVSPGRADGLSPRRLEAVRVQLCIPGAVRAVWRLQSRSEDTKSRGAGYRFAPDWLQYKPMRPLVRHPRASRGDGVAGNPSHRRRAAQRPQARRARPKRWLRAAARRSLSQIHQSCVC